MKIATFDSGLRWGDKNLRWGSPSYLLEYGDPGWVYDPNSASQPPSTNAKPRKKKTMPKSDYIKKRDADFSAQLLVFKLNITDHVTTFGLTTAQVTGQAADADYFAHALACQDACSQCTQQWTAWKDIVRDGGQAGTPPGEEIFPTAVPPVAPGIERRFRDLVKIIKAHPAYNTAIGEALGIEGATQSGPEFSTFKPELKLVLSGGLVMVLWSWLGHAAFLSMLEIHVDRGDGHGFVLLTYDTTPDYLDTTPLPATAAKWSYKAIFRVGDQRVGQWSNEVSITVGA
jgi:hypothetical protein